MHPLGFPSGQILVSQLKFGLWLLSRKHASETHNFLQVAQSFGSPENPSPSECFLLCATEICRRRYGNTHRNPSSAPKNGGKKQFAHACATGRLLCASFASSASSSCRQSPHFFKALGQGRLSLVGSRNTKTRSICFEKTLLSCKFMMSAKTSTVNSDGRVVANSSTVVPILEATGTDARRTGRGCAS
jgi:hypothetical protein